jgi:leucyl/phenylalanyl-tRNA--protein transferase
MKQQPFWISPTDSSHKFPDASLALREPDGLLAVGGDLSAERILSAYRNGIFPWYSGEQPILWWSPDPRTVLIPSRLKISRSLRKTLRKHRFTVTLDLAFESVIKACAEPRADQPGTWITHDMAKAYGNLHQQGYAHSIECWQNDTLAGGLYGIAIGRVFFGESMFSKVSEASKVALCYLARQLQAWEFGLIDCQVYSGHLASLGAEEIPRDSFIEAVKQLCEAPGQTDWKFDYSVMQADW